jgi:sugar lactone lactonase YvrE
MLPLVIQAQSASQITGNIDSSKLRALPNHLPSWATSGNDAGALPPEQTLSPITLVLSRSAAQEQALESLLADQQNPHSANYHHWLTPSEMAERFGVSEQDVKSVNGWLQAQGLHVNWVSHSRMFIGLNGSAADASRAFHTELHYYNVNGKKRISISAAPMIPEALTPVIKAIHGLSTVDEIPLHYSSSAPADSPGMISNGGEQYLAPADFSTIYDLPGNLTGAGITIGIVGRSRTDFADFTNFRARTGATFPNPTEVVPTAFGGVDPGPALTAPPSSGGTGDQGEATLDVFRAGSVAPGANLLLVVATSASGGVEVAAEYMVETEPVPVQVINVSFGECELDAGASSVHFWDTLFQQAAAEGISAFVASGDSGASGCDGYFDTPPAKPLANSPNYICSSSYATCTGGTEFNDTSNPSSYWSSTNGVGLSTALSYIPEGGWNEPLNSSSSPQTAASGGGVSTVIATPSWQSGIGVPAARTGRYTPDVAFSASGHDAYFGCFAAAGGSCVPSDGLYYFEYFYGTSAAAPSMAGVAALLDQMMGSPQGNLNPQLYQMAASTPAAFHDVTVASSGVTGCDINTPSMCNNSAPGPTGLSGGQAGFPLTVGYDEVTGLGSLDVQVLFNNLPVPHLLIPKLTLTCSEATYNGSAHSCIAAATAVDGVTPVAGSFSISYTGFSGVTYGPSTVAPAQAGTYSVVATFTSTDSNYMTGGTAGATLNIVAPPPVFLAAKAVPYMTSLFAGTPNQNSANNPYTPGQACPSGKIAVDTYGDGCLATEAVLYQPWAVVFDSAGNAYIADTNAASYAYVRKVDAYTGVISIFAGGLNATVSPSPCSAYSNGAGTGADPAVTGLAYANVSGGDGCPGVDPITGASYSYFKGIRDLAIDANYLYIDDSSNSKIRKVSLSSNPLPYHYYAHEVEPVAGAGSSGWSQDGSPNTVQIKNPYAVAVDTAGNVFFGDQSGDAIRRVTPTTYSLVGGVITPTVGSILTVMNCAASGSTCSVQVNGDTCAGVNPGSGASRNIRAYNITGLVFDASGDLYAADRQCYSIYKIANNGANPIDGTTPVTTLMGNGVTGSYSGGSWMQPYTGGALTSSRAVVSAGGNNLYIINSTNAWFYDATDTGNDAPAGWIHQIWNGTGTAGAGCTGSVGSPTPTTYFGCPAPNSTFNAGSEGAHGGLDAYGNLYIADGMDALILKAGIGLDFAGTAPLQATTSATTQEVLIHGSGLNDAVDTTFSPFSLAPLLSFDSGIEDCKTFNNNSNETDDATDCTYSVTYSPTGAGLQTGALIANGTSLPLDGYGVLPVSPVTASVSCLSKTYDGTPAEGSCTCALSPSESQLTCGAAMTCSFAQSNAGIALPVTCTGITLGGSTSGYILENSSASTTANINPATPILTTICPGGVYNDTPYSCSGSAMGVGGAAVSGSFNCAPGSETNAGSYPETCIFTSTDNNYAGGGTTNGMLVITPAIPTLSEACLTAVSNGSPQPCTPGGTATGVGGAAVSGSWTYVYTGISGTTYGPSATAPSAGGSYDVLGTFVSSNGNYNGGTADSSMRITTIGVPQSVTSLTFSSASDPSYPVFGQAVIATATVTALPSSLATPTGSVTFAVDSNPTQTVSLVNGVANLTLNGLSAITHTIVATYNGDTTYATSFDNEQEIVSQATPTIYPNCYPAVYDGNPHSCPAVAIGVDGLTPVPGSWTITYSGSSTAPTSANIYQVSLIFTPSDANYTDNSTSPALSQLLILNPSSEMAIDPGTASIPTWPANPSAVNPQGLATDGSGNLYLADTANNAIDEISIDMYGSGTLSNSGLVTLVSSGLNAPQALTVDSYEDIYVADTGSGTIQLVSGSSLIQITNGLTNPRGITSDADGNIYVSDTGTNTVKLVDTNTGNWIVVAGGGIPCSGKTDTVGDGCPATQATLNGPVGLATDAYGNLYIADAGNQVIRKVTMNPTNPALSVIATVAGTVGQAGSTGDNALAVAAKLNNPLNVVVDSANMLYIVDSGNSAVRLVDTTGTIKTWMGTLGTPGSNGADGLSVQGVKLIAPTAIALDAYGNVYVSDSGNARTIEDNRNVVTLDLGTVTVGQTGVPVLSTITNIGSTTLNFMAPWEFDINPGEVVTVGQGNCRDLGTLASGGNCKVTNTYEPLAINNPASGVVESDTIYINSDASNNSFTEFVLNGTPVASIPMPLGLNCPEVIYDGAPHGCTATGATDPNSGMPVAGTWSITPGNETAAGIYQESATFTPSDPISYIGGTASATLIIDPATPALSVICMGGVYTGNPYSCTGSASGIGGVPVAGTFAFNPGSETAVGSYPETGTFTSSSPNYISGGTASGTLTITKATPALSITCAGGVYNSTPYSCTGSATGVGGATVAGTFAFNPGSETAVGSYPETGTFTSTDPDYSNGGMASGTLIITKATPALSVTCAGGVYNGNPYSCTGLATGVGGAPVAGTFAFVPATESNAGNYPETGTFSSSDPNYASGGMASGTLTITKATPALLVTCTGGVYNGTPYSCTGLATGAGGATVAGTFAFSPGSEINAGSYPEAGTFTSADPNYVSGGATSVTLTITKATPAISIICTGGVYNGTPYSCSGSATGVGGVPVAGTFAFNPGSETNAGSYLETGTFTSTDPNYMSGGTATGTLVIGLASQLPGVSCPGPLTYDGNAHSCAITGGFGICISGAATNAPGSATLVLSCTGDSNHNSWSSTGAITINPATPLLTLNCAQVTYDGNAHSCIGTAAGVGGASVSGTWSFSPATENAAGSYPVTGTFSSSNSNYASGGIASGTLGIAPAMPSVVVTCPTVAYDGNAHSCAATATGIGGISVSGSFSFAPASETAAGSYLVTTTFTSANSNYNNASASSTLTIYPAPSGVVSLTLSTTSVNFPATVMLGQSSGAQYVLITSTGTAPLQVTGVKLGGANPGDFLVSNQAGSCATMWAISLLGNHAECNLRVVFAPTGTGTRSAILYINDNATGSPQQVILSGTAISGVQLTLSASTFTFPATAAGSTAPTQYLTLKSTGFANAIVSGVSLSDRTNFVLSDQAGTCTSAPSTTLLPGADCNIRVQFRPQTKGAISATITITDNSATSSHVVMLSGTGN